MAVDVVMPQMGESIFEGTITKWLKKPGDKVQRDEPLFEISTDKVDAEIPAPASGVLQEIKVSEGATVQINTVVGTIAADGEGAAPAKAAPAKSAPAPAAPAAPARQTAPAPQAPAPSAPAASDEADDDHARTCGASDRPGCDHPTGFRRRDEEVIGAFSSCGSGTQPATFHKHPCSPVRQFKRGGHHTTWRR